LSRTAARRAAGVALDNLASKRILTPGAENRTHSTDVG
jgi:hypothetical protein